MELSMSFNLALFANIPALSTAVGLWGGVALAAL